MPATAYSAAAPPTSAPRAKLSQLDDIRDNPDKYSREEEYRVARELLSAYPDDPQAQWRAARAAYDLSCVAGTPDDRRKALIVSEALPLIKAARATEDEDPLIYRWHGILLSKTRPWISTEAFIKLLYEVRSEWDAAIRLAPQDAFMLNLLGRWCVEVATMPWWKRKIAATLFATPPSASLEEALDLFQRAEAAAPRKYKVNQESLAATYAALGKKEAAVEWALSAVQLPNKTADDAEAGERAMTLLKSLDPAEAAKVAAKVAQQ